MNWAWITKMAWRDSRRNRSRLFLFISSIILGIGSLVALNTFHINLQHDIDRQAAQLIGADLELQSRRKPSEEVLKFIDSIQGLSLQMAKEERFISMMRFPQADGSHLVQVHALSGDFPFYGRLETLPEVAHTQFGEAPQALVAQSLMTKFNAEVQDSVQLGLSNFAIGGHLISRPGQTSFSGAMSPSVYVPLAQLANSGLQQEGSRIEYSFYFKLADDIDADKLVEDLEDRLTLLQLRSATVKTTKERTGRSFEDVGNFMQLVGFVALLLGCIGVASAVHIYVREKMASVAILRCLGASSKQTFIIFLLQFASIGLVGGVLGAILGTGIQYVIPMLLQEVFPVTISSEVSWMAILMGICLGVVIAVWFTLLPLLAVRHVSPLQSLRVSEDALPKKDGLRWVIYALILLFIGGFSRVQLNDWLSTLFFTLSVVFVFGLLYWVAKWVVFSVKKFFPTGWSYLWRQGLSNLYRPNNQTITLLVAIGFGTALIATLFYVQDMLMQRVKTASSESQANMLLFDIQPSQRDGVRELIVEAGFPVVEDIPIVTMHLMAINGKGAAELVADSTSEQSPRAFRGEIRATYRDSLTASEKLVEGEWHGQVVQGNMAKVSLDKGYADNIGVQIGDTLLMNVQGIGISAVVSSFREVDWNRFQSNFRMVFATGTIDHAPQFYLLSTQVGDESQSVAFQQKIVDSFPNVTVIDMNAIISVLETILQKIGFVIQFIGGFSILTGVIVLISSVRISKYQRIRENVLLRTLGASRRQILLITIAEYLFLGVLAAITGVVIALLVSNILAVFVFESAFIPSLGVTLLLILFVAVLTVVIGLLNSFSALNRPPLEVIRKE